MCLPVPAEEEPALISIRQIKGVADGFLSLGKETVMNTQKVMKSYDELEYRDDFMFGKVMEDRTVKVFYNCTYKADDVPEEIRKFYDYVMYGRAGNDLTKELSRNKLVLM